MMPVGPLMKEHRLIEQMIDLLGREKIRITERKVCAPDFIEVAIDFIRTYADACHHGKEEDILFKQLKKKKMSAKHKRTLEVLLKEHKRARKLTRRLEKANVNYRKGRDTLDEVVECLDSLVKLYPKHIDVEDNHFFLEVMDYFTDDEKEQMLEEMFAFDRQMIHNKYKDIVSACEK